MPVNIELIGINCIASIKKIALRQMTALNRDYKKWL